MMKPYESYKATDQLWLDSVPSHWNIIKTKHIFQERVEKGFPNEPLLVASQNMGVVPKGVYGNRTVEATKDLHLLKLVKCGDFVISLRSFQGGIEYAYYQGIISPAYTVMTVKSHLKSNYFRHLAKSKSFIELLQMCVTGIREGQNIDYSKLKNFRLPVPSYSEQDQIVRYLDWQTSKINTLVQAKKRQIELLKEQKQAIINKAITKGLDDTVAMKDSGVEWLGEVPVHWKSRFLFQLAKERTISNKGMVNDNLLSLSYGKIINKNINTTDGLLPMSFETYQVVTSGNIILRLTDLQNDHKSLRVGLVTQLGIITSAYTCLTPQKNALPEFLYNLLHSYDICKVFYGMGGGVRQSIGYKDISKLICLIPSLEEQQAIVTYLEEKTSLIDKAIAVIEKEIELVSEYKTSLISSVVTGKVDVRDIIVPEFDTTLNDTLESDAQLEVNLDDSY